MDDRKKILLGNKDILTRNIKDFYLDISLSKDNKELLPQKYDNIFDVNKFYEQERNECKNFVIYGTLDSYSWDCNNITIKVYQSPDLSGYLCQVKSKDIVNDNMPFKNIYNKLRGRYIIDNIPTTFTGCSVYLKITTSATDYVLEQQLIFTTLTLSDSGEKFVEKLPYGLNEAVITCDGEVIEVNNDFDFFYNKHWIKKDIFIPDLRTMWIGNPNDSICLQDVHGNTGILHYNTAIEVYTINNQPTGNIVNNHSNGIFIPSITDTVLCPLPTKNTLTVNILPSSDAGNIILNPTAVDNLYYQNDTVHITAIENTHCDFINFKYNNSVLPYSTVGGIGYSIDVPMNASKTIVAEFKEKPAVKTYASLGLGGYADGCYSFFIINNGDIDVEIENSFYNSTYADYYLEIQIINPTGTTVSYVKDAPPWNKFTLNPGGRLEIGPSNHYIYYTEQGGPYDGHKTAGEIINYSSLALPGNASFNNITNRYDQCKYIVGVSVNNPISTDTTSPFNDPTQSVAGSGHLNIPFNVAASESNIPQYYMFTDNTGDNTCNLCVNNYGTDDLGKRYGITNWAINDAAFYRVGISTTKWCDPSGGGC